MIQTFGDNNCCQLGPISNNKNSNGTPVRSPPIPLDINISNLSSLSNYSEHTVITTTDGDAFGVGDNRDGRISGSLPYSVFQEFTKIDLRDRQGQKFACLSAVCGSCYTLYHVFRIGEFTTTHLTYASNRVTDGYPILLNIGEVNPISLFGGFYNSAAICSDGSIVLVTPSVAQSPSQLLSSSSLPSGARAVSVACCEDFIFVLSEGGRLFTARVTNFERLSFLAVTELESTRVAAISGTYHNVLALCDDGRVLGKGTSYNGAMCAGSGSRVLSNFTEISAVSGCEVKSVCAGMSHCLFVTVDGKVISCGENRFGQLGRSGGPSLEDGDAAEAAVVAGAEACSAGMGTSVVFVGCAPARRPNERARLPERRGDEREKRRMEAEIEELWREVAALRAKVREHEKRERKYKKAVLELVDA